MRGKTYLHLLKICWSHGPSFPPANQQPKHFTKSGLLYRVFKKKKKSASILPSALHLLRRAATDHNADNTTAMLKEWLTVMQKYYHYVEWRPMDQPT